MRPSFADLAQGLRTSVRFTAAWSKGSGLQAALQLAVLTLILALAGCKSSSPSPYVSPRVVGRVLDGQTHQPLEGVKIRRLTPDQEPNVINNVKGGQAIASAPAVRTAADGTFVLVSQRSLTPFNKAGWYSVSLTFEHPGYARFITNYTIMNAVKTPKGEPEVNAGDLRLRRNVQ